MTKTPHSYVIIAPQARWDDIRAFLNAFGYEIGDGVPMSPTGNAPITHRGCHGWLTAQEALDFTGRPAIVVPPGYNFGQATAILQQIRITDNGTGTDHGGPPPGSKPSGFSIDYVGGLTKRAHFDQVASDRGQQVIETVGP